VARVVRKSTLVANQQRHPQQPVKRLGVGAAGEALTIRLETRYEHQLQASFRTDSKVAAQVMIATKSDLNRNQRRTGFGLGFRWRAHRISEGICRAVVDVSLLVNTLQIERVVFELRHFIARNTKTVSHLANVHHSLPIKSGDLTHLAPCAPE